MSRKAIILASAIVFVILLLLHFVPVYNRVGYMNNEKGYLCIGYSGPEPAYYRIISGDLDIYRTEYSNFMPNIAAAEPWKTTKQEFACHKPVELKLYIL